MAPQPRPTGGEDDPLGAGHDDEADAERWTQLAGFSLFIDVRADDGNQRSWQTRIYHEESGDEIVLRDGEASGWLTWVLRRIDSGTQSEPDDIGFGGGPASGPSSGLVVALQDVQVTRVGPDLGASDGERMHIEGELIVSGIADLERSLGAAILRLAFSERGR
jgi:hypothetical protein